MIYSLLPTQNINFSSECLEHSGYIITQWRNFAKEPAITWFKTLERTKKSDQGWGN